MSKRRHIAQQFEMPVDGGFRLTTETAVDGERIAREKERQARDKAESAKGQRDFFINRRFRKNREDMPDLLDAVKHF
ncbi:MAG: hypothetical protein AB1705_26230, partial [Verrucomicrobiota bacterium]